MNRGKQATTSFTTTRTGQRVYLEGSKYCHRCHATKPMSEFGYRRMPNGDLRPQPYCISCRKTSRKGR